MKDVQEMLKCYQKHRRACSCGEWSTFLYPGHTVLPSNKLTTSEFQLNFRNNRAWTDVISSSVLLRTCGWTPVVDCVGVCEGTKQKSNTYYKKKGKYPWKKAANKCVHILFFGLYDSEQKKIKWRWETQAMFWQSLEGLGVFCEIFSSKKKKKAEEISWGKEKHTHLRLLSFAHIHTPQCCLGLRPSPPGTVTQTVTAGGQRDGVPDEV